MSHEDEDGGATNGDLGHPSTLEDDEEAYNKEMERYNEMITRHQLEMEKAQKAAEKYSIEHKNQERSRYQKKSEALAKEVKRKHEDRLLLEEELDKFRVLKAKHDQELLAVDNDVDEVQRSAELEQLILKRMELARVQALSKDMSDKVRNHEIHLEAVTEELGKRNEGNVERVERLLKKGDMLEKELFSGDYDEKEKARIAEALYEKESEANEGFSVHDAIVEKRMRRFQDEAADREDAIRGLNKQREKLLEEEIAVKKKKHRHDTLVARGVDFLVEVELGNAPPLDFILKNADLQQQKQTALVLPEDVSVVVDRLGKNISKQEARLDGLKHKVNSPVVAKPYNGEQGLQSYKPHQVQIAKEMRQLLLTKLLPKMFEAIRWNNDSTVQFTDDVLQSQLKILHEQKESLEKVTHIKATQKLLVLETSHIIDETIEEAIIGLYREVVKVRKLATRYSHAIILRAIKTGQSEEDKDKLLSATLSQCRKTRDTGKTRKRYVHRLPTVTAAKLEEFKRHMSEKGPNKKKARRWGRKKHEDEPDAALHVDELEDDTFLLDLGEATPVHRNLDLGTDDISQTLEELTKLEEGYGIVPAIPVSLPGLDDILELKMWKHCQQADEPLVLRGKSDKGKPLIIKEITAAEPSNCGRFLAVAVNGGLVLVYDIQFLPRLFKRLPSLRQEASAEVTKLVWGMDTRQLATIDRSKVVSVWDLSYGYPEVPIDEGQRMELLYPGDLERATNAQTKKAALQFQPERIMFHPSFNIGLKHSSLMVALNGGDVVKWNLFDASLANPAMFGGAVAKLPSEPAFTEHATHQSSGNHLNNTKKKKKGSQKYVAPKTRNSYITREFLVSHSAPIVFIGQVGSSNSIVTVDANDYVKVWPYKPSMFTGFGWFVPSETYRISTTIKSFSTMGGYEPTETLFEGVEGLSFDQNEHPLWWWNFDGTHLDGKPLSKLDINTLRTSAEEHMSSEVYKEIRKAIQEHPLKETVHGPIRVVTYAPWSWEDKQSTLVDLQDEMALTKISSHTFVYWEITLKGGVKKSTKKKTAANKAGSTETVLVMHSCHPLERTELHGIVKDIQLSTARTDLVVSVEWAEGGGTTCIRHDSDVVIGYGENTGHDGSMAYFMCDDDFNAWFLNGAVGPAFYQVHMFSLIAEPAFQDGDNPLSDLVDSHSARTIKPSPFLVTFPVRAKEHAPLIALTSALDVSKTDMLCVFRRSTLYMYSVQTANLVHKIDEPFASFGNSVISMRVFMRSKFEGEAELNPLQVISGETELVVLAWTHKVTSKKGLKLVRFAMTDYTLGEFHGRGPNGTTPRWQLCPNNMRYKLIELASLRDEPPD